MHHRMLVTIAMPPGASSEDARRTVLEGLINDDSFCGEGGRFGAPLCDWFVIGGRWSGMLADTLIGPAHKAAVVSRIPDMDRDWFPRSLIDTHAEQLNAIWRERGGTGPSPYTRHCYTEYDDDAMVVTPEHYAALLAQYAGEVNYDGVFVDLDFDPVGPDFVGRKWLVVVDYHN